MVTIERIETLLAAGSWTFERLEGREVVSLAVTGATGRFRAYAQARGDAAIVYSVAPETCPEPQRGAMAELLTRINYGLVAGNFEMDLDDGEVRYKTALALGGTPLTEPLFDGILSPNLMAMQRYLPALRDVAAGRLSPVEAVAVVEGGAPPPG